MAAVGFEEEKKIKVVQIQQLPPVLGYKAVQKYRGNAVTFWSLVLELPYIAYNSIEVMGWGYKMNIMIVNPMLRNLLTLSTIATLRIQK